MPPVRMEEWKRDFFNAEETDFPYSVGKNLRNR